MMSKFRPLTGCLFVVAMLCAVALFAAAADAWPGRLDDAKKIAGSMADKVTGGLTKTTNATQNLATAAIPFETRYFTDYYVEENGHVLFREVINKLTGDRLHCSYVGDRELIAALLGDTNANIKDELRAVLPKLELIAAANVTSDEAFAMVDSCNQVDADADAQPGLKAFLGKLQAGFKNMANYLFIFPGTKWCGAGNVARNLEDLGRESETDRCCRDHDHADDSIARGETKHQLKNPLFYTITRCDHDNKFHKCLADNQQVHSSAVGTMFFNILKTQCFENRKQAKCVNKMPLIPCKEYTYDENSEERFQIFDPVRFESTNSSVIESAISKAAFYSPGIDNVLGLLA